VTKPQPAPSPRNIQLDFFRGVALTIIFRRIAWFAECRAYLEPWLDKSHLGLLRWLHFLALAYLMNGLFRRKDHWLAMALPRRIAEMGRIP